MGEWMSKKGKGARDGKEEIRTGWISESVIDVDERNELNRLRPNSRRVRAPEKKKERSEIKVNICVEGCHEREIVCVPKEMQHLDYTVHKTRQQVSDLLFVEQRVIGSTTNLSLTIEMRSVMEQILDVPRDKERDCEHPEKD